jgi:hypothetical protein
MHGILELYSGPDEAERAALALMKAHEERAKRRSCKPTDGVGAETPAAGGRLAATAGLGTPSLAGGSTPGLPSGDGRGIVPRQLRVGLTVEERGLAATLVRHAPATAFGVGRAAALAKRRRAGAGSDSDSGSGSGSGGDSGLDSGDGSFGSGTCGDEREWPIAGGAAACGTEAGGRVDGPSVVQSCVAAATAEVPPPAETHAPCPPGATTPGFVRLSRVSVDVRSYGRLLLLQVGVAWGRPSAGWVVGSGWWWEGRGWRGGRW